jgi:hypothetical protein
VGLRAALVISLTLMASPLLWLFFSPAVRLTQMPAAPPEPELSSATPTAKDGQD